MHNCHFTCSVCLFTCDLPAHDATFGARRITFYGNEWLMMDEYNDEHDIRIDNNDFM